MRKTKQTKPAEPPALPFPRVKMDDDGVSEWVQACGSREAAALFLRIGQLGAVTLEAEPSESLIARGLVKPVGLGCTRWGLTTAGLALYVSGPNRGRRIALEAHGVSKAWADPVRLRRVEKLEAAALRVLEEARGPIALIEVRSTLENRAGSRLSESSIRDALRSLTIQGKAAQSGKGRGLRFQAAMYGRSV